ncbi:MucR family transcriptional regulator [Geodermatophilus sp. SYSU D00703]
MLHPVGPLPAAVYWRRRLLVLALVAVLLGGGGWLLVAALRDDGGSNSSAAAATGTAAGEPAQPPALERVVPSLASVQTPTPAAEVTEEPQAAPAPAPQPGGPCSDDMIALEVRTPGSAPVGGKPTFELVVTNVSPVPCVRTLDKGLQELVLRDGAGDRLWGSNDCVPEATSDTRTLAPGESVSFPVVWSGLSSQPGCSGDRVALGPGQYLVRGRLDTRTSADAPFAIT